MSKITIKFNDAYPNRIMLTMYGNPGDMIEALVNCLAEVTRSLAKPERLHDLTMCISQEYSLRVFSRNFSSVKVEVDGGEHQ